MEQFQIAKLKVKKFLIHLQNTMMNIVLRDFESYVNIQEMVDRTYGNKRHWNQMSLVNIAYGGMFSSDTDSVMLKIFGTLIH